MKALSQYRIRSHLALAGALLFGSSVAQSATYDLFNNFPDHQGDNSFYAQAYAYGAGSYRPLAESGAPYAFVSRDVGSWWVPYVAKDDINGGGNTAAGYIAMHPSELNWVVNHNATHQPEYAVLAWQAPAEAYASLSGQFFKPDYAACGNVCNGTQAFVQKNGEPILWSTNLVSSQTVAFALSSIHVQPGDLIYFGVNGRGNDQWDETWLQGAITTIPVPEPETWAMLLAGLGLVVLKLQHKLQARSHLLCIATGKGNQHEETA